MAKLGLSMLLLLLSIFYLMALVEPASPRQSRSRAFIESSCQTTRYPALCVHCLSSYVTATNATLKSSQELAQVSLTVSLAKAWYTRAYIVGVAHRIKGMKGNRDYQAFKDCLNQINDSVYHLTQSIRELKGMGQIEGDDFTWHMSNVETWVSAAITDVTTCVDEFSGHVVGGKTKATIKAKVLNVAQVTSNALALFHRFAAKHRAASSSKKP